MHVFTQCIVKSASRVSLHKVVERFGSGNLTLVIMDALRGVANMERLALAKTLLCLVQMVIARSKAKKWE